MKKKVKPNDLVLVKWIDAFHLEQGWMFGDAETLEFDNSPVWTTGFVVKDSKEGILIAQTWFSEDCANVIGIPKGMIQDITVLGNVKEHKFEACRKDSSIPTF